MNSKKSCNLNNSEIDLFKSISETLRQNKDFLSVRFYYYMLLEENWINHFTENECDLLECLLNNLISFESDFKIFEIKLLITCSNKSNFDFISNNKNKILNAFFKTLNELFWGKNEKINTLWSKVFEKFNLFKNELIYNPTI